MPNKYSNLSRIAILLVLLETRLKYGDIRVPFENDRDYDDEATWRERVREREKEKKKEGGARDRRAGKCGREEREKVKGNDEKGKKGASETPTMGKGS